MLLDHAGREPCQLNGPGLQPGIEIGVLQGSAYLMTQGQEELVVQSGKRIARVTHEDEGGEHRLVAQNRQHRGVGVGWPGSSGGVGPVASELWSAGLYHSP